MNYYRFRKTLKHSTSGINADQEWKNTTREMLLSQIRTSSPWKESSTQTHSKFGSLFDIVFARYVLKPVAVAMLAITVVFSTAFGTVQAAQASLPGETLYPVKLGIEQAQVSLAFSEERKTELEMSFADVRLHEVVEIIQTEQQEEEEVDDININIKTAIIGFSEKMDSVQKRLEKIEQEETSEEVVLEISGLVNEKTLVLEENLLEIKEKIIEESTQPEVVEPVAVDSEAIEEDFSGEVQEEQEEVVENEEQEEVQEEVVEDAIAQDLVAEETVSEESDELLVSIELALDAVDNTNTKSLEVFVDKAVESEDQEIKQEAVEKIQAKIEKVEKDIAQTEEKIEQITFDAEEIDDNEAVIVEVLPEEEETTADDADDADSTDEEGERETTDDADDADSTDEEGAGDGSGIISSTTPEMLIDINEEDEVEDLVIVEEKPIKEVIEDVQEKPQQAQDNIDDAKKLLDDSSIDGLGEALGKMLEAKEIVKQADNNIGIVEAEITKQVEEELIENSEQQDESDTVSDIEDQDGQILGDQAVSDEEELGETEADNEELDDTITDSDNEPKEEEVVEFGSALLE